MAGGAGFAGALSSYLINQFTGHLANVMVFVPTSRVAARVRAQLALEMSGVLPAVLPLKGNGELADLLSFEVAEVVDGAAVRVEIMKLLRAEGSEEEVGGKLQGERLWRRVDSIYRILDKLALHGITVADLRRTVPAQMVGRWEMQAATLIAVAQQMERWLARRGEVLPGAAERMVLVRAAEILGREDCEWVPVVAGILEGVKSGVELAEAGILAAAAKRGRVIFPDLGPVTEGLVGELKEGLEIQGERLAMGASEVKVCVAETEWDEVWLAALAVKRAKAEGKVRVAVVCPSPVFLQRVAGVLERWGMVVPVRGAMCMDKTAAGRMVLGARDWGMRAGRPVDWLEAMGGFEDYRVTGLQDVLRVLAPLGELDVWLELEDWRALMAQVLGEAPAPQMPVSEGILLLGPLDARLLDFDYVVAAGAVEGVWPLAGAEAWLSEVHLRALGLADFERKCRLMGTEFESVVRGGSGEVLVLRSRTVEGRETVPSRFIEGLQDDRVTGLQTDAELIDALEGVRRVDSLAAAGELGVFRPEGALWPKRWSASLIEAMLACPYKALGERVLRLMPLDPLTPEPDARTAGLLAHRWLEKVGVRSKELGVGTSAEEMVAWMLELAEAELRHEPAVVRAIWKAKFAKLAPALVAQWLADGRQVAAVERKLAKDVGAVTVTAKADRVEEEGGLQDYRMTGLQDGAVPGGAVIIDFKTSTPPSWAAVAGGEKPQLAIEAWLLGAEGVAVEDVEYWQLRGYGPNPLKVARPGGKYPLEALVAPVADGIAGLVERYGDGADFPAVPDMAGGGLMATGHCARCELAGVCRRKVSGVLVSGV